MARPPRAEGNRAIGLHRLAGNPALMEARNPENPATNLVVSGEQVEVVVEDAARVTNLKVSEEEVEEEVEILPTDRRATL